jgi:hypothetical protein
MSVKNKGFVSCLLIQYSSAALVFSNQLVKPAASTPADDVHHYIIPPKVTIDQ